eukprot:58026-Chlamydomonas_euryale.AAC.5
MPCMPCTLHVHPSQAPGIAGAEVEEEIGHTVQERPRAVQHQHGVLEGWRLLAVGNSSHLRQMLRQRHLERRPEVLRLHLREGRQAVGLRAVPIAQQAIAVRCGRRRGRVRRLADPEDALRQRQHGRDQRCTGGAAAAAAAAGLG